MKEKIGNQLRWIANSVILAGGILLLTGLYYWMIKAGIPYQDPPLELQIQYAVNIRIGEILLRNGFWTAAAGGVGRLVLWVVWRSRKRKE